ncbi:MAG: alpha/beta hydrolase [Deltaproteobacteria bacterium]|nr:alpha/beta hydrolase [Deltaproteobacteria bacterium]
MQGLKLRNCFTAFLVLTFLFFPLPLVSADSLEFNPNLYTVQTLTAAATNETITYRAYEGIVYVANPVDVNYQKLNFYVPEAYYEGGSIGRYNARTAPIFMPNGVGGYMPGAPKIPGVSGTPSRFNAPAMALSKGYVVAAPAVRGRTQSYGKAPALIVDLKAAVRYLRHNDRIMPGDAEKIVSNGTSAGGALSSLIGATGNNKDYEPYLREIGAAKGHDDIFAASCYCPITNLDNSDKAYEWLFNGIWAYTFLGGGIMNAVQIQTSDELKALFPAYLNGLRLKASVAPKNDHMKGQGHLKKGAALRLDAAGEGSFKEYVKSFAMASAQKALDAGAINPSDPQLTWITFAGGTVTDLDLAGYSAYDTNPAKYGKRMKPANPAFDGFDAMSWENSEFGTATIPNQHFTQYSYEHSTVGGSLADAKIVKMLNPMNYIGTSGTMTAKYWRIRHGAVDKDTALPIPVMLATKLQNSGSKVDFAIPWGQGHGGDYDLEELFAWMDEVCAPRPGGHHD